MTSRSLPQRRWAALTGTFALAAFAAAGATAGATTEPPADSAAADVSAAPAEVDRTDWPESITLAAVPSEESTSLEESYATIIALLEEDLGIEVEFFQATDYAAVIEAMIAGDVDVANFGPFSYVIAVANGAEIAPVGAIVDAPDATPGYQSYGFTLSSNDEINAIEDFAGKNICFVDPGSTSGFLYPSAGLIEAGIDPETGVTPVFAGGHDASVLSVKNGDCDAGFAYDTMVTQQLIDSGDIVEGELKVVWESEIIAGSPIAVLTTLPESLRTEISRIILDEANIDRMVERGLCTDVETCMINDDEESWGYLPVDDAFYDGVRAVCEATEAEACGAA
jgi:phosphonate transport system substrate-binding protein